MFQEVKRITKLLVGVLAVVLGVTVSVVDGWQAQAAEWVQLKIPVRCETRSDQVFAFRIYQSEPYDPDWEQVLDLADGEDGEFRLSFTEAQIGEHYYHIAQKVDAGSRLMFEEEFWLHVKVAKEGGVLKASAILWQEGKTEKLERIVFTDQENAGDNNGGSTGGDGTGDDSNNGGTGSGDDNNGNGGTGSGDGSNGNGGTGNGTGNDGGSNGSGSGTGNDSGGSSNGTGNGSGNGSDGSDGFWGNGSFWGSSSSNGSTGSSLVSTLVRTGDPAKVLWWIVSLLAALACVLGAWRYQRNKKTTVTRKDREDG